jgi:hypothetical protein
MRAAGLPPISTVPEPVMMVAGGPAQTHESPMRAAGSPAMSTVGSPGGRIGPPTCGVPPGVAAGHACWSVIRAAGFISIELDDGAFDRGRAARGDFEARGC